MDQKLGIKDVINHNYCIGCGLCTYVSPESFAIKLNNYGQFEAEIISEINIDDKADTICPFSDYAENEDVIGRDLYPENNYVNNLGFISATYAGYVKESDYRLRGSSGGLGSWLCVEFLRNNLVDGIIHLVDSESDNLFFEYGYSDTSEGIRNNSKSKYYPIKLDKVAQFIKQNKGRYLVVGIPCMIKSIRLLSKRDRDIQDRVLYTVGLVCGHLKSTAFGELLGWQMGVKPSDLTHIDFRTKLEGYGSNQYGVTVSTNRNGVEEKLVSKPVNEMFGTNWGLGYFKSKACDFCDDVTAETSDITIGDAWLPEYVSQYEGTNVIVVRNPAISQILKKAVEENRLVLDPLEPEKVIKSQSSGINHRRLGLQYRLYLNERDALPSPQKRVTASNDFDRKFKKIQELRIQLRDASNKQFYKAKQKDNINVFINNMQELNDQYAKLYKKTITQRIINKIRRMF